MSAGAVPRNTTTSPSEPSDVNSSSTTQAVGPRARRSHRAGSQHELIGRPVLPRGRRRIERRAAEPLSHRSSRTTLVVGDDGDPGVLEVHHIGGRTERGAAVPAVDLRSRPPAPVGGAGGAPSPSTKTPAGRRRFGRSPPPPTGRRPCRRGRSDRGGRRAPGARAHTRIRTPSGSSARCGPQAASPSPVSMESKARQGGRRDPQAAAETHHRDPFRAVPLPRSPVRS